MHIGHVWRWHFNNELLADTVFQAEIEEESFLAGEQAKAYSGVSEKWKDPRYRAL